MEPRIVDADRCRLSDHLRDIGTHDVRFSFYHDIDAIIAVTVKALEDPNAPAAAPAAATEDPKRGPRPKPIITDSAVDDRN